MKHIFAFIIFCIFTATDINAYAAVQTREVIYNDGPLELKGTLAFDDALTTRNLPGIVIYPEWWGPTEFAKRRARELAAKGHIVLVADMYGNGITTTNAAEAKTFSDPLYIDRELMRTRARAAVTALKNQVGVDNANIALVGFCFGGTNALELALRGDAIKGVAAFHAGLNFPDKPEQYMVKASLLVMHGGADPLVPAQDKQDFITAIYTSGADLQFIEYSGAQHAFTNPAANSTGIPGVAYDQRSELRSFAALDDFLKEIFSK